MSFEGSKNKTNMIMSSSTGLENAKDSPLEFGIKYGYDADNFRFWGGYFYQANSSYEWLIESGRNKETLTFDWTAHKILFGIDWTPRIASNFKLDLGINYGLGIFQVNFDQNVVSRSVVIYQGNGETNGLASIFGTKLGVIAEIDKNNEIEFGIKGDFTVLNIKFANHGIDNDDPLMQGKYGVYLGYTYKF